MTIADAELSLHEDLAEHQIERLWDRFEALEAENKRLREALEAVLNAWNSQDPDAMRDIARAALSQEEARDRRRR